MPQQVRPHLVLSTEGGEASNAPFNGHDEAWLMEQLHRAVDGARARAVMTLAEAPVGSAAKLWWQLCTELRVPHAAAHKWWRRLIELRSAPGIHHHDAKWMRSVAYRAHDAATLSAARRPVAVRLASFFLSLGGETSATASPPSSPSHALLDGFALCAPGLEPADHALASLLCSGDGAVEEDGDGAGGVEAAVAADSALLMRVRRQASFDNIDAAAYARSAASLLLERRCLSAAAQGGAGSAVREARHRIAELERNLGASHAGSEAETHNPASFSKLGGAGGRAKMKRELTALYNQLRAAESASLCESL